MGVSFSTNSIEALKSQVDIVDVIGREVKLKRAGSNFKGLCPFHNEKTPSFVVSGTKQYFNCFGCGQKGDVISFVEKYYNLDFGEAVEKLAKDNGITLEKRNYNDNRKEYFEINKLAARFFYDAFTTKANPGYTYMKNRGIAPATMKKFGIGYADKEWDSLYKFLCSKGIEPKKMLELGLISQSKGKYFDKFRNRVIFPIINTSGNVIGFGGRAINKEDMPKYLNSPESVVFQKKNNLYGLNLSKQEAGKKGYIILVEGYMDVISLHQGGIRNVAASLGTALTQQQGRLIHRYVKDVVLSYDADSAGRKAALRGIEILKVQDCKVKVLHVTDGKDPDDFIKEKGRAKFLELVDNALPYGDYKLESAKAGFDLSKDEDILEYTQIATKIIADMSPIEQELYKQKLARDVGISEVAIDRELNRVNIRPEDNKRPDNSDTVNLQEELVPLERNLLKLVLTDNKYARLLIEKKEIPLSTFSEKVVLALSDSYDENDVFNQRKFLEEFGEGEEVLREIIDEVAINNDHDKVFRECLNTGKVKKLKSRERELLTILDMAEEGGSNRQIEELTAELIEIQKEIKKLRN